MKNLCSNKQNCDVTPTTEIFTDPCPYVQKLIRVWYQCVGDGNFFQLFFKRCATIMDKKLISNIF